MKHMTMDIDEGTRSDARGFALVTVLLVVMAVGALTVGAAVIGANHLLINRHHDRASILESAADAGLEKARARLNADKGLYPDSGYVTLEENAPVTYSVGENGRTVPGVRRWTYAGPAGITSGQYGIYGNIVSIVRDEGRGVATRRLQIYQESFARFAYFTDSEGSSIYFGGGDQLWGPVHSNDEIKIHSTGATFHDDVTTHKNVRDPEHGTFKKGYEEYVPKIPMPETQDLLDLEAQAAAGGTAFDGDTDGGAGEATTRLHFVAADMNGDGDTSDDGEGFVRVYQSGDPLWVVAKGGDLRDSENCGGFPDGDDDEDEDWTVAADLDQDDAETALTSPGRRCYLGGDEALNGGTFVADDGNGQWLLWGGTVHPDVLAARPDDAAYLFPINRKYNADFKGVIFVDGNVAVSGKVRGRVTIAATGNIALADDLTYVHDPGSGTCEDLVGFFSGQDIVVSDNTLNAPKRPWSWQPYYTYDDTKDEFFHGTVLALGQFTVENYNSGSEDDEACAGTPWGRGCLYLTGGIIQTQRGPVGTTSGTGYLKRYSYDSCAARTPPPYFPTTGHFVRGLYYPVDPVGFDVGAFFEEFQAN